MAAIEKADQALRNNDKKLRKRHNIERIIRGWKRAEKACPQGAKPAAARGHADAWALLAHWSGSRSDQAQAKTLRLALKKSKAEPEMPVVEVDDADPKTVARALAAVLDGIEPGAPTGKRRSRAMSAIVDDLKADNPDLVVEQDALEDVVTPVVETQVAEAETKTPVKDAPAPVTEVKTETPKKVRYKKSTRRASTPRMAELLRIRKIVIDPGHGGKDYGASKRKVREKDVNLAVAKKLGKILKSKYGIKVVYTRTTDTFVSLRRRAQIANQSGADLFVSVHANANRRKDIHGIETYYLNTTSNRYAQRLAKRENTLGHDHGDDDPKSWAEADAEAGLPEGELGRDLRLILADLAMRSATVESKRLAGYVQSALVARLRKKYRKVEDLGVKHALFYVLLGARMPSVLVETGFVTNQDESKRLVDGGYQNRLAESIAHGIGRFAKERETFVQRLASRGEGAASASGLAKASP